MIMLKKYGKMFSKYSFLIIVVLNLGFLTRAILYNKSLVNYGDEPFESI